MLSSCKLRTLALAAVAMVVAACGSSSSSDQATLRVVHAVSDAPRVNVYLNDDQVLADVDFRTGSAFLPIAAGTYDVRVEAIVPSGNLDVIDVPDVEFASNSATTIAAIGDVSEASVAPLPLAEPTEAISAGNFRLQVTHASPEVGPVYIALTTPELPIDQAAFVGPLSYTETFGPGEFAAGNYQVRVIAKDPASGVSDADVVFDTGELPLGEGADLHVLAVTSTVPSTADPAAPISLVVLDGNGSFDIFDVNTGAFLTIVHDAPGVPAVDVFADVASSAEIEEIQLANDLEYGNFEDRQTVPALEFNVGVRLASDNSGDAFGFAADLMAGMGYTAIARLGAESGAPEAQVLVDDYRSVATEAKVRLVHGSPSAGPVDVYVFATNESNPPVPGVDEPLLLLEGFTYGSETGFLSLPAGSYDVFVTLAGNAEAVAIPVPGLAVAAGGVYTAIARDPLEGQSAFGVILIAD
jgi:hypothetical protein